jgi:hypothetical protein
METRLRYGRRCLGTRSPVWKHLPNWRRRERMREKSALVVPSNSAAPRGVAVAAIASMAGITLESSRFTNSENSASACLASRSLSSC